MNLYEKNTEKLVVFFKYSIILFNPRMPKTVRQTEDFFHPDIRTNSLENCHFDLSASKIPKYFWALPSKSENQRRSLRFSTRSDSQKKLFFLILKYFRYNSGNFHAIFLKKQNDICSKSQGMLKLETIRFDD